METYSVLDHGFIRIVDKMGDDKSIVAAARISYGKSTSTEARDRGLIRYLMKNNHTSPFEMCEIKLHLKMPLFVARQWLRHRTANVNEYSARYSVLSSDFYIPEPERLGTQSKKNHQATDKEGLELQKKEELVQVLRKQSEQCLETYTSLLEAGLSREVARMIIPTNFYTEMYWKIDLHNLLHFIRLRIEEGAQEEIRVYAQVLADIVKEWVPYTYEAFCDYKLNGYMLSAPALQYIKNTLHDNFKTKSTYNLSAREWDELETVFFE